MNLYSLQNRLVAPFYSATISISAGQAISPWSQEAGATESYGLSSEQTLSPWSQGAEAVEILYLSAAQAVCPWSTSATIEQTVAIAVASTITPWRQAAQLVAGAVAEQVFWLTDGTGNAWLSDFESASFEGSGNSWAADSQWKW